MKNITKWLAASVVLGLLSLATERADAILSMSYTTDSQYLVGTVIPGAGGQFGGQAVRDAYMTNTLLAGPGGVPCTGCQWMTGSGTVQDPTIRWFRATWPGAGAATAINAVAVTGLSGGTGNVTFTLTGTYQYLVAAYDGMNGGAAVWNISSLTAGSSITIYGYAKPEKVNGHPTGNLLGSDHAQQGYFRITSYTLLNPTGVPDGGATVMLLGMALGVLAVVRRYLLSS